MFSSLLSYSSLNDFEHFCTGICLSEVSRASHSFGRDPCFGIFVSGDEDDGGVVAHSREPLSEFNTRYAPELDVEDKAAELRMLRVGEKRLR